MGVMGVWGRAGEQVKRAGLALFVMLATAPAALAAIVEMPRPWQIDLQPAASPVRQHVDALYNEIMVIITLIVLLVVGLIAYVCLRFNAKRHPVPTKLSHNALIEVTWTIIPVLILVSIAVPSFKLIYYADAAPHPAMTLKVTGHQWYWSYEYPDQGGLSFDSNILPQDQAIKEGKPRLLAVDNPVVLPVNTVIKIEVAGSDVLHSWFVPSMGVQEYAVPGRVNHAWMSINHVGTYYGQCNQLCGINHPFMPIEIKAVSKADFDTWVAQAKKKFSMNGAGEAPLKLAAAAR